MTAQLPFTADVIQAFGWALLHSFWQAFFIFACLRLVLFLWPQAGSSIKYNLSYISLAGIFTWFSVTLWQQIEGVRRVHAAAQFMIETGIRQSSAVEVPVIYKSQSQLTTLFPTLEMWFPVLVAIYVAGVAVMTIKLSADLVQLQQIRKKQVFPIDEVWEKHMTKLKSQLRIPRKVKLLISQYIQVPVMIGFLKPVILLPVAMFNNLTAEQLEAILLHELAHIKRNDYLLNIFQSIVETILFFNPFIWWISKNIRLEREHCCDDLVLKNQVQPLHYAKALVALEEYRLTVNSLAMAAADNKQHLFHRIKRIMEMKTKNINYTQKLLAVMIIAVGLVSIAWLNPPHKEKQADKQQAADNNIIPAPLAPATGHPIVFHAANINTLLTDTVPATREEREKERDRVLMENYNTSMEAAKKAMENVDWSKMNAEVANAMKNVDWQKINDEVKQAMKNIDWDQINKEVSQAMKNVDWKQVNKDMTNAIKEINWDEMRQALRSSMKEAAAQGVKIDPDMMQEQIRKGMESAKLALAMATSDEMRQTIQKSIDESQKMLNSKEMKEMMEKTRQEIINAQQEIEQSQQQIEQTQQKIKDDAAAANEKVSSKYKTLIKKMADDKLIDADGTFTIEKKDDVLTINGVRQSDDVLKKYADLIGSVDELSVKGKKGSLKINANEH
ncbi:M56 family metallopeptidase [Chitinophaga pinensis]|uniref:Peptidase M56 BlaR1 n=1 Tax=Chitinophaga pinensis (strain ATCC 43595 / DSM 2588 / LMG 13176 / NBRC 15968 / NCIMB 11800 / UQM 2034) TaxID=485918 RepID=A0A979GA61_CHIPD|nr:M56 family metallopeptidase [Chitinophaga pinensis]ACU63611.1 peptidase M56 BlaR1 [Chitinophaga pinensis DSM 2588]